jgi:hypothetical protein
MAPPARGMRMKKLSKQQGQTVLKEDQLDTLEPLTTQPALDTGVEKSEEKVRSSFVCRGRPCLLSRVTRDKRMMLVV